jgi:Cdc6-like AAA superfamily ATPase
MSAHRDPLPPWGANPFPATPVAPVQGFDADTITIETAAIREAVGYLGDYLTVTRRAETAAGQESRDPGNVVAIVGDYGTGKTHLAMHLLWQVRRVVDGNVHAMYVDAPADTFLSLYRERFVPRLRRSDVRRRVHDYYADIVADSLEGEEYAASIIERLRGRQVDPRQVVERMRLGETALLRELQDRLRDVTRNDAYGIALTLLLRPGFETSVWEWLAGYAPDATLRERGITSSIESEADALEAIGVFAILYGSQDHRFVLVIDELEKVFSASRQLSDGPAQAFKKLLAIAAQSGAFLVLSGLPDFIQSLEADVRQRIGHVVRTSALTSMDVTRYIKETLEHAFGESRLAPFTQDVVAYLTTLAGGNARRVMQLCHHAYRQAASADSAVTHAMVSKSAREQFELLTTGDMRAEVRRVLDTRGWPFQPDHTPGGSDDSKIDYWIPIGGDDAGCAVLLTDSVIYDRDVRTLQRRVQAVNAAVAAGRILLVINGYLNPGHVPMLNAMLPDPPLIYDPRRFTDDFDAALQAATRRLERLTGKDEIEIVRDRMERITQMQSRTQNFLERLYSALDASRSSSDRRLGVIEDTLEGLTRAPGTAGSPPGETIINGGAGSAMPPRLPEPVDRIFEQALNSLSDIDRLNGLVSDAFGPGGEHHPHDARRTLFRRFGAEDAFYSVGVALLLQRVVLSFRDAVGRWYREVEHEPTEAQRGRLSGLCQTYDALYEYLPVFRLESLAQLTARLLERDEPFGPPTRPPRPVDVREALDSLGSRVRTSMLEALSPGPA